VESAVRPASRPSRFGRLEAWTGEPARRCTAVCHLHRLLHRRVNQVSLIKMDIEGAEAAVLPSLKPFLLEYKLPAIWLSLHTAWWGDDEARKRELLDVMQVRASECSRG